MKALIFDGTLHLDKIDKPEPGGDEVLIRVAAAGICSTDIEGSAAKRYVQSIAGYILMNRG